MTKLNLRKDYSSFINKLIIEIRNARYNTYRAVDKHLVELYLSIGRNLHNKIDVAKWGEGIVEKLSRDLRNEFPDMKGFSTSNLWNMKQFYYAYKDNQILQTLSGELSWSHNLLILNRLTSVEEKEFYLKTCVHEHWSYRELERQIDAALFERYMLSKKTAALVPKTKSTDISAHFKDEYVLDFLGLNDRFSEKDLRKAIVHNLRDFFLEVGKYFTFVGEEYTVSIGNSDFKIDLLFYHRVLRCLVAVELKIGDFKPEYVGKMQFYLGALDEKYKLDEENPSVGLILCKSKNDDVVRIAVSKTSAPMQISAYKTQIIDQKLLKQKLHSLPLPKSIAFEQND